VNGAARSAAAFLAGICLLGAAGAGVAQNVAQPGAGLPVIDPGQLPGRGAAPMPGGPQPAPVKPDTAVVEFALADSLASPPLGLAALPDTVPFGGVIRLGWAFGDGGATPATPVPQAAWLAPHQDAEPAWWRRWAGRGEGRAPAVTDSSAVALYRVYRTDPFRFEWNGVLSPVITVSGRVERLDEIADIRGPRGMARFTWLAPVLLAAVALAALLAWWLWRRRRRPEDAADWAPPPPAWPAAAAGLDALLRERLLERGDGVAFLDGLSAITRDYAAARYGVPAREMTGAELTLACRRLGYRSAHPAGFARLISDADRRRFDPEPPEASWCREQAVQFFGRLARVRVTESPRGLSPTQEREAQAAWRRLTQELGLGAGREPAAAGRPAGGAD
jgi:hypothetical protein